MRRHADVDELCEIALAIARTSKQESVKLQALQFIRDSAGWRAPDRHELALDRANADSVAIDYSKLSDHVLAELAQASIPDAPASADTLSPAVSDIDGSHSDDLRDDEPSQRGRGVIELADGPAVTVDGSDQP
jgi:hypothetical protein